MIPELGLYAIILATILAGMAGALPLIGWHFQYSNLMGTAKPLTLATTGFIGLAFFLLIYAFLVDDFSLAYVVVQSNTALPDYYKVSAVWGGHEGSMVLWVLMLSGWAAAVAWLSRSLPQDLVSVVLAVINLVLFGFMLFILLTSNPFERILPNVPLDGQDLNPLLQDIGLILHPPLLYMGYVGFAVAFAFAIAALITGQFDSAWARWARPWTDIAWVFLTLGIALGSWWAYYELGWGGWWFWDPVENASLMPWLVGTALMHSLSVTEKRSGFKVWTVLLAIFAFAYSLLGTFLVRSGVLTSVHAFANDPDRGMFILALLTITVAGSLLLFAFRANRFSERISFNLLSRESFLLINNVLLVVSAFVILTLTLMPLIWDALGGGSISIGAPFFNMMINPIALLLVFGIGVGQLLRWKQHKQAGFGRWLAIMFGASLVLGWGWAWLMGGAFSIWLIIATVSIVWVLLSTSREIHHRLKGKSNKLQVLRRQQPSWYGMMLGHLGVIMIVLGAAFVSHFEDKIDVRLVEGDRIEFAGYELHYKGIKHVEGPNWVSDTGVFDVYRNGDLLTTLYPEKRFYTVARQLMTEAGIDGRLYRDLYVSLGEQLDSGAWTARIQVKPYVRFLWLGAIVMSLGGVLAVLDRRYRGRK